jgi:hypothetical protein
MILPRRAGGWSTSKQKAGARRSATVIVKRMRAYGWILHHFEDWDATQLSPSLLGPRQERKGIEIALLIFWILLNIKSPRSKPPKYNAPLALLNHHSLSTFSVVIQKLFDEIYVCQHHSPAAVSA